jgi:hypothetical protein
MDGQASLEEIDDSASTAMLASSHWPMPAAQGT